MAKTLLQNDQLNLDFPLKMSAVWPTPTAVLEITGTRVKGDGAGLGLVVPPVKKSMPTVVDSTIDFQTGATTGATFAGLTFPSTTIGQFRRLGLTLLFDGQIQAVWSAASASVSGLADAGTLFRTSGLPIGYLDLEATAATAFKTAGSSTSVIENTVGGVQRVFSVSGGGGSGAAASGGAGGRIYFDDPDAEDLNNFVIYADSGATPTDGVGGSPNITKSLNTATPLIGTSSFRMTHPGAATSRQGQGASITTNIALDAPVVAGDPITVQFRYRTSAGYASGQVRMFVFFVGPNTVEALNGVTSLGVFGNSLNAETGNRGQFTATTSCPAGTTAVRVIAHIAGTDTAAWDIDFDEITIGVGIIQLVRGAGIVGEVLPWTTNTPPPKFLFCNGQEVSRTVYSELFQVIGTTYGAGDGFSTFNLPDLRGRVIAGRDNMGAPAANRLTASGSGIAGTTLGASGGSQTHVLTTAQMPSHNHTQNPHSHAMNNGGSVVVNGAGPNANITFGGGTYIISSIANTTATNNPTGGDQPHQNTQPTLVLNYIIRFQADESNIISSTQANFLSGSFRASRNGTNQTGVNPNNTFVKINFNSTAASTDYVLGGLAYDTSNSRFIANKPLKLRVSCRLSFDSTNTLSSNYTAFIRVNGVDRIGGNSTVPTVNTFFSVAAAGQLNLVSGDIVEVFVYGLGNNSVNTLTLSGIATATYFEASEIPDLSVVGISGAPLEILAATSNQITPSTAGWWYTFSGNSLTLTPGVWEVWGMARYTDGGTSPSYIFLESGFFAANGGNSATTPAALGTLSNLTILSSQVNALAAPIASFAVLNVGKIVLQVTQTETIFLNAFANMTTPGNARIQVFPRSQRIR